MASSITLSPILFAILTGLIPCLIWLSFWLHIDNKHPGRWRMLVICFVVGGMSVLFAVLLQQFTENLFRDQQHRIILWAGIEELLKLLVFLLIAYKSPFDDEALDPAMYLITIALGFASLENIFYILRPMHELSITTGLLTGGLRFFGSSLLHTIASAFIGIMIGISDRHTRFGSMLFGLVGAIFLHSTFNFFILKNSTASALQVYGYLWVAAIMSYVILEKLRRIPIKEYTA